MSNDIKKSIFDTFLFTYTGILLCYVIFICLRLVGFTDISFDQEFFIAHFQAFALATTILTVLALAASLTTQRVQLATVGELLFNSNHVKSKGLSFWNVHVLVVFALTVLVSLQVTESSLYELLDRDGLDGAYRLWSGLTHPNLQLLPKAIAEVVETVFIAFLATAISVPIAFLLAFFCAKNLMTHPVALTVYSVLRLFLNISRSVEPLIWALIFTVWVGVGPFAGMLALMIHSVASLTKYYSEIIENVDEGPLDGVRSTGANAIQVIWFAVVPQIVLPYIGMTVYRWDTNVRMATVIGLVGGGGIGTLLIQYQGQAMWAEVGTIIVVIAIVVWLMDTASAYIREALK